MNARAGVVGCFCCLGLLVVGCDGGAGDTGPHVALRAENLLVPPSTGPITHVRVRNLRNRTFQGAVVVQFPAAWKMNRTVQPVTIKPRQTVRVPFVIDKGSDAESNAYFVRVKAVGGGVEVSRSQRIVCASTPYFKPKIDGRFEDWAGAIPATFVTRGKKTTISTYWSRRSFSLLVAVEEDALTPLSAGGAGGADAVQIAISPGEARTPTSASGKAERNEFLLAAGKDGGKCYALLRRGERLSAARQARALGGLELDGASLAVRRTDGVTYYECSIPLKALPGIRPDPGREICFSVLVHDPDGTGLRDWGRAVGLWAWQRNRLAWCLWRGARWPKDAPFDNKIEWGLCTSKH